MPHIPTSTVTISKEDGKLVIVRKPVFSKKFVECFWLCLLFVILTTITFGAFIRSVDKNDVFVVLIIGVLEVVLFMFIAAAPLIIRDIVRKRKNVCPPDYDVEVLTFDTDKFVVKYHGYAFEYPYRHNISPMLYQVPCGAKSVDLIISCTPIEDINSIWDLDEEEEVVDWVLYEMKKPVDKSDAERIHAALKEYFDMKL